MPVFERQLSLPCTATEAFAYHAAPHAFARLNTPFAPAQIVQPLRALESGARAVFDVALGPIAARWVAVHEDVTDGSDGGEAGFVDVMERGPFSTWRHEHRFVPATDGCTLIDRISFSGPVGPLGDGVVQGLLDRMFRYRHTTTRLDVAFARALPAGRLRVAISGASGLIGQELTGLLSVLGHDVVPVVRGGNGADVVGWDPNTGAVRNAEGLDAFVHLAGENIGEGRLTAEKLARVRRGRVDQTALLLRALAGLRAPPRVVVGAAAVGVYGDRGDDVVDEASPPPQGPQQNALSELCAAWEAALLTAVPHAPWRAAVVRVGIAQSPRSGALARVLPVFRAGGGGVLGDGRAYVPAVAVDDVAAVFARAVVDDRAVGVVNAVGPAAVTQADYAHTVARVLHRPCLMTVPRFALRLALGELGDRILDSQRVEASKLKAWGHAFRHATLEDGLRHQLGA